MIQCIAHANREDGVVEPVQGLHLHRMSQPTERIHGLSRPSFCVIAQGGKDVFVGESCYRYDPEHYLLATVELPLSSCIVEASKERPYLSLRLDLGPALVGSVMVEIGIPAPRSRGDAKAIVVSALDADLLDATLRLVQLIDSPAETRVLAPLVTREIVFRLLLGEHLDATSAGFRAGYNDASHFSRDHKKRFGTSPARDVARLRANLGGASQDARI